MRALMWMKSSGTGIAGGHKTQIEQTASHLEELGVRTTITADEHPDLRTFDVVHSFGLHPADLRRCRQFGVPVVTSTIYWTRQYAYGGLAEEFFRTRWAYRLRMGLVLMRAAVRGTHIEKCEAFTERQWRLRVAYEMSDVLLPNSELEAQAIINELGVSTPYQVVPNAADPRRMQVLNTGERAGVVFAGRFEPHKNQLGLIKAMRGSAIPLTLVGPAHPHHAKYLNACRAALGKQMRLLGPLEDLQPLFNTVKVHALPSWFETTGLSSLEAALCGCNVVTTSRGFPREYFEDLAWYCDPAKPETIRAAIEAAHAAPVSPALRDRIVNRYTWRHTAQATREGYVLALSGRRATEKKSLEQALEAQSA